MSLSASESDNQASGRAEESGRLGGRVAIVTGGSGSIGSAIAARLTDAGASVVVGDLVTVDQFDSRHLDVTSEESVARLLDEVISDYGHLDILVNNAGIMFEKPIAEQDRPSWDRMIAINLTGPMLATKHAALHMKDRVQGSIVNVGSIEGDQCNPAHAAYAATKAGIHGLTRATAIDLGPLGIRCNAVAPGWIDTPLNASYVDSHPNRNAVISELAKLHPIGRVGTGADVADVVTWLASDESRFVTGQVITVDGGRTARPPLPGMLA